MILEVYMQGWFSFKDLDFISSLIVCYSSPYNLCLGTPYHVFFSAHIICFIPFCNILHYMKYLCYPPNVPTYNYMVHAYIPLSFQIPKTKIKLGTFFCLQYMGQISPHYIFMLYVHICTLIYVHIYF